MALVPDTCVLLDILEDDPLYGAASARACSARLTGGLVICPVTFVELAPAFNGSIALQEEFLNGVGVHFHEPWTRDDGRTAHAAWARHIGHRRGKAEQRRPMADVLIGAFATRFDGILTRNAAAFRRLFPDLRIIEPSKSFA